MAAGDFAKQIQFLATDLIIIPQARLGLGKQRSQRLEAARFQRRDCLDNTGILGHHVAQASKNQRAQNVCMVFENSQGKVGQNLDGDTCFLQTGQPFIAGGSALVVLAGGQLVTNTCIDHQNREIIGKRHKA